MHSYGLYFLILVLILAPEILHLAFGLVAEGMLWVFGFFTVIAAIFCGIIAGGEFVSMFEHVFGYEYGFLVAILFVLGAAFFAVLMHYERIGGYPNLRKIRGTR